MARLRMFVVATSALVAVGCASGRTPPAELHPFLLQARDLPPGARPVASSSGETDLPRLRTFLPIDQEITLSLKNAGFQAGRAAAFEIPEQRGTMRTSVLYRSIAMTFFSPDGAAQAMRILRDALRTFSPQETTVHGTPGDERFLVSGAPGSITPQNFLAWRRTNVVVVLSRAPADDQLDVVQVARAIDDRTSGG